MFFQWLAAGRLLQPFKGRNLIVYLQVLKHILDKINVNHPMPCRPPALPKPFGKRIAMQPDSSSEGCFILKISCLIKKRVNR